MEGRGDSWEVGGWEAAGCGLSLACGASDETVLESGANIGICCGGPGSTRGTAATDSAGVGGGEAPASAAVPAAFAGGCAGTGSGFAVVLPTAAGGI